MVLFLSTILSLVSLNTLQAQDCSNYGGVSDIFLLDEEICGGFEANFDITFETNGEPQGSFYFLEVYGSDGSFGFGDGFDDGFGYAFAMPEPMGCEPSSVDYFMDVFCEDGTLLESNVFLGTVIAYPQYMVEIIEPSCGEGEAGSATLVSFDGTVCDGPIEGTPGVNGACEEQTPATLNYSFEVNIGTLCEETIEDNLSFSCTTDVEGCTDETACNYNPEAVCDDGSCNFLEPCCPMPLASSIPTGLCAGDGSILCIEFDSDISGISEFGITEIFSDFGNFGFEISRDNATNEICFELFLFAEDPCFPTEDNFYLFYECENGDFMDFDMGTISIYPEPPTPNVFPSLECGGIPFIEPQFCGEFSIIDTLLPINDCENPVPGSVTWMVDPGFDITNAPDCYGPLTGSVVVAPCLEDCSCEGIQCGGTCTELELVVNNLPTVVCSNEEVLVDIMVSGLGADFGDYIVQLYLDGQFVGDFFHSAGGPTDFEIPIFVSTNECTPTDYDITFDIFCFIDGTILNSGTLGTLTVYPSSFLFEPEEFFGEPCGAPSQLLPPACGTIIFDTDPLPTPECGIDAMDQFVGWTVDPGFDTTGAPDCFDTFFLEGQLYIPGCPLEAGEICFIECLGEGTLSENCECVVENAPTLVVSELPAGLCEGEFTVISIDLMGTLGPDSFFDIEIIDQNGNFVGGDFIDEFTEFPLDLEIFVFGQNPCLSEEVTFTVNMYCSFDFSLTDMATVGTTIYPSPFNFQPLIFPGSACGELPEITPNDFCGGTVNILDTVLPVDDCEAPMAGSITWELDPGFDIANAPACFTDILMGTEPIAPCLIDCPCDGTQCGDGTCLDLIVTIGELPTEVCANETFEIALDITGSGSDFGSYFVQVLDSNGGFVGSYFHNPGDSTEVILEVFPFNQVCVPELQTYTYEIYCGFDFSFVAQGPIGSVNVYPSVFAFEPEIIQGQSCGNAPQILPPACGTIVLDPETLPSPECGIDAQDQIVIWTATPEFDISTAPACFDTNLLEGEIVIPACPLEPGDFCFIECLGEGILNESCECIVPNAPSFDIISDLPTSICDGDSTGITIDFEGTIAPGSFYELQIVDQNGNFVGFEFIDDFTPLPLDIQISPFTNDPCQSQDETFTLNLYCGFDFSLIDVTTISTTVYPSPFNFAPFVSSGTPCGALPEIFPNGFCNETINIIETILPVDDCEAPVPGSLSWEVDPGFDITNAPACFTDLLTGTEPIPPCLIDCPCDGTQCGDGTCFDLMVMASPLIPEVCANEPVIVTLDITGQGADLGAYNIQIIDGNGFGIGGAFHSPGDPTTIITTLFPFVQGCEPELQDFIYEINCASDFTLVASGTIGSTTVYPSIFQFLPNIVPSIACQQELQIQAPACGTLITDPDPIPVPGCGGVDTEVNWSVDPGFVFPPNCPIDSLLMGTEPIFACSATPGNPCDDGNPCTVNDVLDADCNCVGEGPMATLTTPLPTSACSNEPFELTFNITDIPDPDGVYLTVTDQFGSSPIFQFVGPNDGPDITVSFFPFTQSNCDVYTQNLEIELICPVNFSAFGTNVPIGTIEIYPPINNFVPNIEPAINCEELPSISLPFCGDLVVDTILPAAAACPQGADGSLTWSVDVGFDTSNAPDCFDIASLMGQETITACSNCCPNLVEAIVQETGPFCTGTIVEVCATFDAPFASDNQVTIEGVDAVAGDNEICFPLELINDGCSFEDVAATFEIICDVDQSIATGFTNDIMIAPDPDNFQYQIFPGGCGFPPSVGSANGSPCFTTSIEAIVTVPPVDGCPPVEGEVELVLAYFDDNFDFIDFAGLECAGFDSTVVAPQPGCSTCPCPGSPLSAAFTEYTCEGESVEVCLEFAPGDEANAIGSSINVSGDLGTFTSTTLTGDGTSTTFCFDFVPNFFPGVQCDPATETFTVDVFCGSDFSFIAQLAAFPVTYFPSIDKFEYEIISAVDNCPLAADLPVVNSIGECDLMVTQAVTTAPIDGCPETAGELTYSIDYINPADFANAPADCAFTAIIDAVEPIPACNNCTMAMCPTSDYAGIDIVFQVCDGDFLAFPIAGVDYNIIDPDGTQLGPVMWFDNSDPTTANPIDTTLPLMHSGNDPCNPDPSISATAFVQCDLDLDGVFDLAAGDSWVAVADLTYEVYPLPQAPILVRDNDNCDYSLQPACPGDILSPNTIPSAMPGEDPAVIEIEVANLVGCVSIAFVDPEACPDIQPTNCPTSDFVPDVIEALCDGTVPNYPTEGVDFIITDADNTQLGTVVWYDSNDPTTGNLIDATAVATHSGADPCNADPLVTVYAFVQCDADADGVFDLAVGDVWVSVANHTYEVYPLPQTPILVRDNDDCDYSLQPACPGDVLSPNAIPSALPGEDPAAIDIEVTTSFGCMATFSVDPEACPAICFGSIAGTVIGDADCDGVAGEPIANVTIELLDNVGNVVGSATTDMNGEYIFNNVPCGTGYTTQVAGDPPCNDPNSITADPRTNIDITTDGETILAQDFTYDPSADCNGVYTDAGPIVIKQVCAGNALYVIDLGADSNATSPPPFSLTNNLTYVWYMDGNPNPVATISNSPYYSPTEPGTYWVQIFNEDTCESYTGDIANGGAFEVDEIMDCKDCSK